MNADAGVNVKQRGSVGVVKDNVIRVDLQSLADEGEGGVKKRMLPGRERCLVGLSRGATSFPLYAHSRECNFA